MGAVVDGERTIKRSKRQDAWILYTPFGIKWKRVQNGRLCKVPRMSRSSTGVNASYPLTKRDYMAGVPLLWTGVGWEALMGYQT